MPKTADRLLCVCGQAAYPHNGESLGKLAVRLRWRYYPHSNFDSNAYCYDCQTIDADENDMTDDAG